MVLTTIGLFAKQTGQASGRLLHIFCNHIHVPTVIIEFCKGGSVNPPKIFFSLIEKYLANIYCLS